MTPSSFPLALSSSAKYQTISTPTRNVPVGASSLATSLEIDCAWAGAIAQAIASAIPATA
jgi:hypothetical protein